MDMLKTITTTETPAVVLDMLKTIDERSTDPKSSWVRYWTDEFVDYIVRHAEECAAYHYHSDIEEPLWGGDSGDIDKAKVLRKLKKRGFKNASFVNSGKGVVLLYIEVDFCDECLREYEEHALREAFKRQVNIRQIYMDGKEPTTPPQ